MTKDINPSGQVLDVLTMVPNMDGVNACTILFYSFAAATEEVAVSVADFVAAKRGCKLLGFDARRKPIGWGLPLREWVAGVNDAYALGEYPADNALASSATPALAHG